MRQTPRLGFLRVMIAAALLPGCASVKVAMPGLTPAAPEVALSEKTGLVAAAERLAAATPPAAPRDGLSLVVFGGRGDAEAEAARAYLSGLGADEPRAAVMADVAEVLRRARAVAEVGRPGLDASEGEIAILERAITDVQHARRTYVAALTLLRDEGVPLTRAEIREVNDALVQACRDIGKAADMVSARLRTVPPVRVAETDGTVDAGY